MANRAGQHLEAGKRYLCWKPSTFVDLSKFFFEASVAYAAVGWMSQQVQQLAIVDLYSDEEVELISFRGVGQVEDAEGWIKGLVWEKTQGKHLFVVADRQLQHWNFEDKDNAHSLVLSLRDGTLYSDKTAISATAVDYSVPEFFAKDVAVDFFGNVAAFVGIAEMDFRMAVFVVNTDTMSITYQLHLPKLPDGLTWVEVEFDCSLTQDKVIVVSSAGFYVWELQSGTLWAQHLEISGRLILPITPFRFAIHDMTCFPSFLRVLELDQATKNVHSLVYHRLPQLFEVDATLLAVCFDGAVFHAYTEQYGSLLRHKLIPHKKGQRDKPDNIKTLAAVLPDLQDDEHVVVGITLIGDPHARSVSFCSLLEDPVHSTIYLGIISLPSPGAGGFNA